jgi:hypothetical protein
VNAIVGAVKAAYNFFAGDAIILTSVIVAFILCAVLARAMHAPNVLVAVIFFVLIAGGLLATLSRELAGRPRAR